MLISMLLVGALLGGCGDGAARRAPATPLFAGIGDVILAEPKALIGFTGPRVIERTIRQKLPEGFQRSEFLLAHGLIDMIVERKQSRDVIGQILEYTRRE